MVERDCHAQTSPEPSSPLPFLDLRRLIPREGPQLLLPILEAGGAPYRDPCDHPHPRDAEGDSLDLVHLTGEPGFFLDVEAAGAPAVWRQLSREIEVLREENQALRREVADLDEYRQLSLRDPLTGLSNRRCFEARLEEEISRARRQGDEGFSLLLIDLDGFKGVNDRHGHAAGDALLQRVADFLREQTRSHDVCCRLGGDEFVVILPGTGPANCAALARRLQERMEHENRSADLSCGFSVGGASYLADGTTREELFAEADRAMYRDKAERARYQDRPERLERVAAG